MSTMAVTQTDLIFVYGSLMSWLGIDREGAPPLRILASRLAMLPCVRRGFGKWSEGTHRWTMNLSGPPTIANFTAHGGVQGVLLELPVSDLDNLRRREGWPPDLWVRLREGGSDRPVSGGLLQELAAINPSHDPVIEQWRLLLRPPRSDSPMPLDPLSRGLLPVPVQVENGGSCLLSWSPYSTRLFGIREALSKPPSGKVINTANQLEYYAECVLGSLHGVDVADVRDPDEWNLGSRLQQMKE